MVLDPPTFSNSKRMRDTWDVQRDHPELLASTLRLLSHGGVLYFVDARGLPVQEYWHDMKFWWPHNEAVIACLSAYEASGEERFAARHAELARWCEDHFADREHGEWFGYLHRDGTPSSSLKGNLWKGPFHMPRMQLVASEVCARLADQRRAPAE